MTNQRNTPEMSRLRECLVPRSAEEDEAEAIAAQFEISLAQAAALVGRYGLDKDVLEREARRLKPQD